MARNRTIKPEFFSDEVTGALTEHSQLLFLASLTIADCLTGNCPANAGALRGAAFPQKDYTKKQVEIWIAEIEGTSIVLPYMVHGQKYWHIKNFLKHQYINRPSKTLKCPLPPWQKVKQDKDKIVLVTDESLRNHAHSSDIDNTMSYISIGNSISGNSISNKEETSASPPAPVSAKSKTMPKSEREELFEYWQKVHDHPRAKLNSTRESMMNKRYKEGYTLEDMKKGSDGIKFSAWHMGENPDGMIYDDLTNILKNGAQLEKFMGHVDNPPQPKTEAERIDPRTPPASDVHKAHGARIAAKHAELKRQGYSDVEILQMRVKAGGGKLT